MLFSSLISEVQWAVPSDSAAGHPSTDAIDSEGNSSRTPETQLI